MKSETSNPIFFSKFYFILFCLVLCGWYFLPNYVGYCKEKGRILSDQDRIELAVLDIMASQSSRINYYQVRDDGALIKTEKGVVEEPIPYENIEEFFKENPNCCDLRNEIEGMPVPLSFKLNGNVHTYVRVRYKVRYFLPPKEEQFVEYRALSNCGINSRQIPKYKIERR